MPGGMHIDVTVRTYGTGNHCEPSYIYDCRHQNETLWFLCIDVSVQSTMCVIVRYNTLFVQPRELSENQSAFKAIRRADAAERAFLLLPICCIVKCACM